MVMMDGNITAKESSAIQLALCHSSIVDIRAEQDEDKEEYNTYQFGWVKGLIKPGTAYTSSIDNIFGNDAANAIVDSITYQWDLAIANGLDHVPIDVNLKVQTQQLQYDVYSMPISIPLDKLIKLKEEENLAVQ